MKTRLSFLILPACLALLAAAAQSYQLLDNNETVKVKRSLPTTTNPSTDIRPSIQSSIQ